MSSTFLFCMRIADAQNDIITFALSVQILYLCIYILKMLSQYTCTGYAYHVTQIEIRDCMPLKIDCKNVTSSPHGKTEIGSYC